MNSRVKPKYVQVSGKTSLGPVYGFVVRHSTLRPLQMLYWDLDWNSVSILEVKLQYFQ